MKKFFSFLLIVVSVTFIGSLLFPKNISFNGNMILSLVIVILGYWLGLLYEKIKK